MSARRSGSFTLSARDKSSNPLARYSLLRFMAPPLWGCLSSGIKFLNRQNGSDAEQASEAKYWASQQDFCAYQGIRPPSPLEPKTLMSVSRAVITTCHAKVRPSSTGGLRHFGHRFAVGCVFTKFSWGVHADLRLESFNWEIADLVPSERFGDLAVEMGCRSHQGA